MAPLDGGDGNGAGRPEGDLPVDLGVGGVVPEPARLAAAVIVAGAGGQQPQLTGEPAQPAADVGVVLLRVVDLDPVEPGRGQFGYDALRYALAALGSGRVREDGDPAGALDQPYRVE